MRYIDFNLFFRFILIFREYTEEVDGLPEALVGGMASLPGLLLDSRSQKTSKSYFQGFRKWKEWANSKNLGSGDIFPAKAHHVAIYLAAIIQTANSPSPVIHAFYSLKCVHNIGDQISPTDSQLVKNILEAGKRRLSKPIRKKEPMTIELI